jgi:hypothetical protein
MVLQNTPRTAPDKLEAILKAKEWKAAEANTH